MMEFFRHCPGCGRRFHIKLVDKKLARLERETMRENQGRLTVSQFRGAPVLLLQESSRPVVVDVEEFQYSYKCKHCGHEWSEKHFEEHQER
jgi:DNA-directed RNA polymerase subunit RPC12/RpoP